MVTTFQRPGLDIDDPPAAYGRQIDKISFRFELGIFEFGLSYSGINYTNAVNLRKPQTPLLES
jgi:hypothetical protein